MLSCLSVLLSLLLASPASGEIPVLEIAKCDPSAWQGAARAEAAEYTPIAGEPRKALRLTGPGETSAKAELNLEAYDKIALRLVADSQCSVTVNVTSGQGIYSTKVPVLPGEQAAILPLGVFERTGQTTGWHSVQSLSISLPKQAQPTSLLILSVQALPEGVMVTDDGLYLVRAPLPRVHPIGMAWPIYAILSETDYPARAERSPQVLQGYLNEMFGVSLPLNPEGVEAAPSTANVFLLGKEVALKTGRVTQDDLDAQGYEGFILRADNGAAVLAGQSSHGTAYATYRFLEQQGCRFYAIGCRDIPKKETRALNVCNVSDKPFFQGPRFRGWYWNYGQAFTSRGAPAHAETKEDFVKLFTSRLLWGWTEHTAGYLVPTKLYHDEHPDYYGLRGDGKRMAKETDDFRVILCTTHPDVLRISAERTLRWIELQNDRKYFNVTQGDDHTWCRCPKCLAMDYEPENHSDRMLYWVNHIAREVAKKYPDKILVTYAYGPTTNAPVKVRPEKNVLIYYAAWPNKGSCPCGIRDFDAPENAVARKQILDWLKVAPGQVGLYDYNSGGRYTLYGMAWKVKWCAKQGMCGFHYCGGNKSFESLFRYVQSRLNWDPYLEVTKLKNEFIPAFYADAAPYARELFDLIYDRLEYGDYDAEMGAGGFPPGRYFSGEFVDRAFALFAKALDVAGDNERIRKDLLQTKHLFIRNCLRLCPGRTGELTDDQYYVFGRNLREYLEWSLPTAHEDRVREAKKRKREEPIFSYKSLPGLIWKLAYVHVELGEDPAKLPPLVVQLMEDPKTVVEKHRQTYFVERLDDGWRVPAIQFTGGQYWAKYGWKCEAKDGAIVRGTMTEVSRMEAELIADEEPPDRAGILEIEGQDNDKKWCEPAPIQIFVNGRKIFEGPNNCAKQGWSRRNWPLPKGVVKKGKNVVEVRNLYNSDSLISHWFMLSELLIRFPEK